MATRFEMVLYGLNPVTLRAAADQAFDQIERLHRQLSLYSPSSEISYINAHAAHRAVPVEPGLFDLLRRAKKIYEETHGSFDITIAPLLRCWGFLGGNGSFPDADQLADARSKVGMHHMFLDEKGRTIRFGKEGLMLDLGSIGKGYALDVAVESLLEAGIDTALVHGGTSTICGFGSPPEEEGWKVAIDPPPAVQQGSDEFRQEQSDEAQGKPLAICVLNNESLSVSGVHGKCFRLGKNTYGHVMDPRTGWPAAGAAVAAVVLPTAAESDAFSTALLVAGAAGQAQITGLRNGMKTLVAEWKEDGEQLQVTGQGLLALRR
jgi:thiamine biosynthesis lipoprotein